MAFFIFAVVVYCIVSYGTRYLGIVRITDGIVAQTLDQMQRTA